MAFGPVSYEIPFSVYVNYILSYYEFLEFDKKTELLKIRGNHTLHSQIIRYLYDDLGEEEMFDFIKNKVQNKIPDLILLKAVVQNEQSNEWGGIIQENFNKLSLHHKNTVYFFSLLFLYYL